MPNAKLRRRLASEAARIIYLRQESDPYRAVLRASRKLFRGWVKPDEFPSETEIRLHLQKLSWIHEGDARFDNARDVRLTAARIMRLLGPFHPRLVGSAASDRVRRAGEISIYVFTERADDVADNLECDGRRLATDHRTLLNAGRPVEVPVFQFEDGFSICISVFPAPYANRPLRRRSTGRRLPQLRLNQLERLIRRRYPDDVPGTTDEQASQSADRFDVYRMLLAPLANVEQRKSTHPEGDALYHSLQVFELARNQIPYDEELLLAALLHDVGKALDPLDHVTAGLAALNGHITDRTTWLIANHSDAHRLLAGTIGNRAKRRLQLSADYDELLLLARCDRAGRVPGGDAPDIDEALDYIRDIAQMCGE